MTVVDTIVKYFDTILLWIHADYAYNCKYNPHDVFLPQADDENEPIKTLCYEKIADIDCMSAGGSCMHAVSGMSMSS